MGQRRGHPGDPTQSGLVQTTTTPTSSTTSGSSRTTNPVYPPHAVGPRPRLHNPNLYQNWNIEPGLARSAQTATGHRRPPPSQSPAPNIRASSPVVNLNASLTQFISTDRATNNSRSLMKDPRGQIRPRTFHPGTRPRVTPPISIGSPPAVDSGRAAPPRLRQNHQTSFAPTGIGGGPRPATPPSKVFPPGLPHPSCHRCPPTHRRRSPNRRESLRPHPANNAPRRHPRSFIGANGDPRRRATRRTSAVANRRPRQVPREPTPNKRGASSP